MWRISASGCSGEGTAGLVRAFRRAQSVLDLGEVDLGFTVRGFAERDDADFMIGLRVYKRDGNTGKQAQGDEALLIVGEPVIFEREGGVYEHERGIDEVESVGFEIRSALRLRPAELDARSVYTTRSGVNNDGSSV